MCKCIRRVLRNRLAGVVIAATSRQADLQRTNVSQNCGQDKDPTGFQSSLSKKEANRVEKTEKTNQNDERFSFIVHKQKSEHCVVGSSLVTENPLTNTQQTHKHIQTGRQTKRVHTQAQVNPQR